LTLSLTLSGIILLSGCAELFVKDIPVSNTAKTIEQTYGPECILAVKRFYPNFDWLDEVLILQNSPLMESLPNHVSAIVWDKTIHIKGHQQIKLVHEIRHIEQSIVGSLNFLLLYLDAHTGLTGHAKTGNILNVQARRSQTAFEMQYPWRCEERIIQRKN